jgi:hypothetical protein
MLDANLRANAERLRAERSCRPRRAAPGRDHRIAPIILYLEELEASPRIPKFVSGNFEALTGFRFSDVESNPDLWIERLHPDDRDRVGKAVAGRARTARWRSSIAGAAPSASTSIFLDQASCSGTARARRSNMPAHCSM